MRTKLALGAGVMGGVENKLELIRDAGFDGVFFGWGYNESKDAGEKVRRARGCGLEVGSLHAPFGRCDKLWECSDEADSVTDELLECLRDCARCEVPVMVSHVIIGFDRHTPTSDGLYNFERLVREAEDLGVKIAFENTEGAEYLEAVMRHFKGSDAVGFCLDTGHEMCYNPGVDMLKLYGERLAYTHINDNLGVCGEGITWIDDLHLLPFDGKCDFSSLAARLAACGYNGTLTFELSRKSKPGRNENDRYSEMSPEEYLAEAYARAARVAALCEAARG